MHCQRTGRWEKESLSVGGHTVIPQGIFRLGAVAAWWNSVAFDVWMVRLECCSTLEFRDQWDCRKAGEEGQTVNEWSRTSCLNNLYNSVPADVGSRTFSVFILVAQSPMSISSFAHVLFKYLQLPPDAQRLGIGLSPFSHHTPLTFHIVKFKQREMAFVSSLKGLR